MSKGWISIHRELQEHWFWKEKREFSKLEAWLDILLSVNHTDKKVLIKNTLFTVKRGQSINSQLTWSKRWKWNRSKVMRFFKLLQSDNMISLETNNKTSILTVCNYDSYQDTRTSDEHQTNIKRTSDEHQTNTNNKDNNINKENNNKMFFDFWEIYPKKVAKVKCQNKFNKLNNKDKKTILETIEDFINYKPFDSYTHPNPETYLNQRRWEDEIPKPSLTTNQIEIKPFGKTNQV